MFMLRLPPRFLFACLAPLAASLPVQADEADVFNFRASLNTVRDDNLYRVPNSRHPEMETITTAIAGVDFNKRVSLQQFIAHVSWVETYYTHSNYLNGGGLHYDGRWLWAVGSHLTGELAADRSTAQNSFAEFPGLRQRNMRTNESQRLNLEYAFHPSWRLTGGLSHLTMSNDQVLTQESDFETNGAAIGIKYTPRSGNWVSFQTRQADGKYTKRPFDAASQFDNEFTDRAQEVAASWQVTGHSTFNGRFEYLERRHEHFSSRNFSGPTGQLSYQYQYSAKTVLAATYQRKINAFQDVSSSYYLDDDLLFSARWDATAKVSVAGRLGVTHRQYRGEIGPVAGARREDDILRGGVDVTYKADRWLELKAGLAADTRNSSDSGLDYTSRQAFVSAIATF